MMVWCHRFDWILTCVIDAAIDDHAADDQEHDLWNQWTVLHRGRLMLLGTVFGLTSMHLLAVQHWNCLVKSLSDHNGEQQLIINFYWWLVGELHVAHSKVVLDLIIDGQMGEVQFYCNAFTNIYDIYTATRFQIILGQDIYSSSRVFYSQIP